MQSETPVREGAAPVEREAPAINILAQYVRELSLEVPQAPTIFPLVRRVSPEVRVAVDTDLNPRDGNAYEVIVTLEVAATISDQPIFAVNLTYGCLVEINERLVADEHAHPVLLVEVPRQMFPFMRRIVADLTVRAGFQPVTMQPLDFGEVYRRKFGVGLLRADGPSAQPAD